MTNENEGLTGYEVQIKRALIQLSIDRPDFLKVLKFSPKRSGVVSVEFPWEGTRKFFKAWHEVEDFLAANGRHVDA